ncbi:MAG: FtsX-like permease family protein, partial [Kordiimonadaceae bacterium]|nr:FtsX-like permease family protein [Kordiimonadaceae bacterium]
ASRRAREVALRKVLGASRRQLIVQHMGEAYALTILSGIIAYIVSVLLLPYLNEAVTKELQLTLSDPAIRNLIISVMIFIGTLAGFYPALILSSFRPIKHLQANKSSESKGTTKARNMLVVFQSVVTIALIIATSVIFAQVTYFRIADRGFDPENLLIISGLGAEATKLSNTTFKEEVLKIPGVEAASLLQEAPTNYSEQNTGLYIVDGDDLNRVSLGKTNVDPDYFTTFKIPLIAGRFYDEKRPMDITPSNITEGGGAAYSFILNEAAVKTLDIGSPQEAIGQSFRRNVSPNETPLYIDLEVIGVVGDAQIHTIKRNPRPEIYLSTSDYYSLAIRVPRDSQNVLNAVQSLWQVMYPGEIFRHYYVEEALAREFQKEQGQMVLFFIFAVLTIIIGCLGLYGLAVFVADRRTKEIGIRKVLGASIADIIKLLIWQFSKPVLVANIFAWPIAGYYMINWLTQYPNRLESPWVGLFCIAAGLIALLIAWITVGSQAYKVARKNPIHALRYE